jgi:ribosome biogenesis protein BRX1
MLKRIKRKKEEEEEQASGSEEETLEQPQKKPKEEQQEPEIKKDPWYVNKQRTLVFSTRGVTNRARHFLKDLRDLLPHSKKDAKLDSKGKKLSAVNEVCEMKDCNNCIFLEARKKKDLYMWVSRTPDGPSAKFLVQNLHTVEEVKLTGNCLKGSRPLLVFDPSFEDTAKPHLNLIKELFTQVFGTPKGHPKSKPFIDHVFCFYYIDSRIWFRNYQIVMDPETTGGRKVEKRDPVLVEIGPRFVLNPIRIFAGSFGGLSLWDNGQYVSPNQQRKQMHVQKAGKYANRVKNKKDRVDYVKENQPPKDVLGDVFDSTDPLTS